MVTKHLQQWITHYDVINRATYYFWELIRNYEKNDYNEFYTYFKNVNFTQVRLSLLKISFAYNYVCETTSEYVVAVFDVMFDELTAHNGDYQDEIAVYKALFTLEGEHIDAYLYVQNKEQKSMTRQQLQAGECL